MFMSHVQNAAQNYNIKTTKKFKKMWQRERYLGMTVTTEITLTMKLKPH